MKASFTFREERAPLLKAKVGLSTLGLPFQSSLVAGDSSELCLSLGTLFSSGPSFRLSYRPNDSFNPLSLLIKSGLGSFGSPIDAPMTISTEFNLLLGSLSNPTFFLHFRPRLGDISLRNTFCSHNDDEDDALDDDEEGATSMERAMERMSLAANTVVPIQSVAKLKLRWGVNVSEGCRSMVGWGPKHQRGRGILPILTLNKIGIEHIWGSGDRSQEESTVEEPSGGRMDLVETCFTVKRQLEKLRADNVLLGKALDEIRTEIGKKGCGHKK